MTSISIYFSKLLIVLLNLTIIINCRDISYELNPKCGKACDQLEHPINLVHISSNGQNDTIHFLWSTKTGVPPTFIVAKTRPNTNLLVDWKKLIDNSAKDVSNAIQFSSEPENSIGLQISRLFFFNDINKTGSYDISYPILDVDWNRFIWKSVNNSISLSSDSIRTSFTQEKGQQFYNGSINIRLRADTSDGRNDDLPHLAFTQLSTSLEINVNDVSTDIPFNDTNRPRLMADILVVNDGQRPQKINDFQKITSIDDEYTPGVFTRIILKLDSIKSAGESETSFLQWKPIAYTAEERVIANTIDVVHSDIDSNVNISDNSRILLAYFGNRSHSCATFNLTFGASDDTNYYDDKKYSSFSLVVGLDSPPDQKLSFLVQMIILVGFGLPLLVMVISALYFIVRRIRRRNYDDLLLSQDSVEQSRVNS